MIPAFVRTMLKSPPPLQEYRNIDLFFFFTAFKLLLFALKSSIYLQFIFSIWYNLWKLLFTSQIAIFLTLFYPFLADL